MTYVYISLGMDLVSEASHKKEGKVRSHTEEGEVEPHAEAGQTIISVTSLPNRIDRLPLHERQSAVSQEWHDLVVRLTLHDEYCHQLTPLHRALWDTRSVRRVVRFGNQRSQLYKYKLAARSLCTNTSLKKYDHLFVSEVGFGVHMK